MFQSEIVPTKRNTGDATNPCTVFSLCVEVELLDFFKSTQFGLESHTVSLQCAQRTSSTANTPRYSCHSSNEIFIALAWKHERRQNVRMTIGHTHFRFKNGFPPENGTLALGQTKVFLYPSHVGQHSCMRAAPPDPLDTWTQHML